MCIKHTLYSLITEILCILLLVGFVIYLLIQWNQIPDQIPAHYNALGVIDRYGNKQELFIFVCISWGLYALLSIVGHFPQIWNTGVTVTIENQERVYQIIKELLCTMKLLVCAVFVYLAYQTANGQSLPGWFLITFMPGMFGIVAVFGYRLYRAR